MMLRVGCLTLAALVAVDGAAQPADPLRTHYERAQSFQLAGDLDRAEAEYRAEVLPRALRRLGNLSGAEGRLDESLELLDAAAGLAPGDVEVRVDLAVTHLRRRDFARAAEVAGMAVAASPRHARARSVLGRALLLGGDPGRAVDALRQALAEEARFETAYALALANLRLGRIEAAGALFDQILASARRPDTLVLVGRAYLDANLASEAARYFAEALERSPAHASAARYLRLARAGGASARAEPPGTVLVEMLPAASAAEAARRADTRAQLEQVLASAWHNLTVIYTKQGRPEPAADAARRSARWERRVAGSGGVATGESAASLQALGLARAHEGRAEEAEALLGRAVAVDPSLGDAWATLARLAVRRGDAARAAQALDRVPAGFADAVLPDRLRVSLLQGRLDEARAHAAGAAPHADVESAAAIVGLFAERGLADEAAAFLEHLRPPVAAAPETAVAIARLRLRQGDAAGAERGLRAAIAAAPSSIPALHLLARIVSDREAHDEAADLLIRARRAGGDTPELLRDLASAAAHAGRVEEALDAARRLAALQPADAGARYLLGVTLLQNQSWHEAIATFASPPSPAAADPRWTAALGMAYFGARDLDEARRAFETTLRLDGSHVEARYHLGLIAREQGRTADAADELRRAISIAPDHAAAHAELGAVYLLQDDVERARAALERAVALDADAPAPHYQLGLLFTRMGDRGRARREMQLFEEKRAKSLERPRRPVIQLPRTKGGPHAMPSRAVRSRLAAGPRMHAGARTDDR